MALHTTTHCVLLPTDGTQWAPPILCSCRERCDCGFPAFTRVTAWTVKLDQSVNEEAPGDLVCSTTGARLVLPPEYCPHLHTLTPGHMLVGIKPARGHDGGHTTWTCRQCDAVVYVPPLNTHSSTLDGSASGGPNYSAVDGAAPSPGGLGDGADSFESVGGTLLIAT
jgi:hypothetical protein